jgi:EpsD family peptidyl-prolyl cis-trans isomerase
MPTLRSSLVRLAPVLALAALIGCGPGAQPASQVAIKVNGDEISVHQVDLAIQSRSAALPSAAASAATQIALATLVEQEMLAQAAREQGLDRDPRVIQLMEAAKRQVLAQALQERVGSAATQPSADEIDRYHDENPYLFAKRRLYQLQETTVQLPADRAAVLRVQLEAAVSADALRDVIGRERLRFSVRQLSISAEDLPLGVLPRVAQLNPGESLALPLPGGTRLLTLLASQPAPLSLDASRKLITQYLLNERKRARVGETIQALRKDAKVEYVGRFAAAATPAAPNAPAAATP